MRLHGLTDKQLEFIATTIRMVALGQLAVFGWQAAAEGRVVLAIVSGVGAYLALRVSLYALSLMKE